ncbi:MAG TPA: DNA/RNA nuclease SfsA [Actinomycetota bacterium]|nr:DNA/RNA nuclease SfsA [Actinomycetota bacterium]
MAEATEGPDVSFGPLVPGRFVERPVRFLARVEVEGAATLAHLPNAGRLRELLWPGADVLLAPRPGRPGTAFDLLLVRVPPEERGPGGAGWACVDARLPARVLAAAIARGAVPGLEGGRVVRLEPPLGEGRADLLVAGPWGEAVVEAKSVTLVRAGAGLFPDSPTERGARHAAALAAERGRRRVLAFVVQRPDARAVRVNEPADPLFASATRAALRAGVEVAAGACEVRPEGLRWLRAVPLEWYRRGAPTPALPDHVRPGLRLLVCGMNPGAYSAWYGMYFARPGNLFWPAMRAAGLVPRASGPGEEAWLCRALAIGFTDVVKRPTEAVDQVSEAEWREGAERLRRLVRELRPGAVCFVGLRGARAVLGPRARPGPQPDPFEGSPCFALPATSRRQAAYARREVYRWFRALAAWVDQVAPPT